MPARDGTGPRGFGPGTGWRKGWCGTARGRGLLATLFSSAAWAVIADLRRERSLIRALLGRAIGSHRGAPDTPPLARDTEFEVQHPQVPESEGQGTGEGA